MNKLQDLAPYLPSGDGWITLEGKGSLKRAEKKLKQKGYSVENRILAFPSLEHPLFLVPLGNPKLFSYFKRHILQLALTIPPEYGVPKAVISFGVRMLRIMPSSLLLPVFRRYSAGFILIAHERRP